MLGLLTDITIRDGNRKNKIMNSLYVRHISLGGKPLSWHLARHIYNNGRAGKIAIVTDKPSSLLASTRKQWLHLIHRAQSERSSTVARPRIKELDERILWMQQVTFSSKAPDDLLEADVTFATVDDFVRVPPVGHGIYVTTDVELTKLHMLTSWMPRDAEVVFYA